MWSSNQCRMLCLHIVVVWVVNIEFVQAVANLSCYQCVRHKHEECDPAELLPCAAKFDRCYTHIMKDDDDGFKIERQCGIGPCTFDDLMMEKTLGIGPNSCDRSRSSYFCLFCCRESGCNKNGASKLTPKNVILTYLMLLLFKTGIL